MIRRWIASAALITAVSAASMPEATRQEASLQDLRGLASQLGDADPAVRDAAMQALWRHQEASIPVLEAAATSANPELSRRAELLLHRLRLGLGPDAHPTLVAIVVQARSAPSLPERSGARQRLANVPGTASPAIARLIRDTLAGTLEHDDPVGRSLQELWPADRWALARIIDELARVDDGATLIKWLERAAIDEIAPSAPAHFAYAVRERGDLPAVLSRWRQRQNEEPTAAGARVLSCLLLAAGERERAAASDDAAADLRRFAWALLDGDISRATGLAEAHPDELTRLSLLLLLARTSGDGEAEAQAALIDTLAKVTNDQDEDPLEPFPTNAGMRRAIIAATIAGEPQRAFALAESVDAAGVIRVLYRRLEFAAAEDIAARHSQRGQDRQRRQVQVMQRRMMEELRDQGIGRRMEQTLSSFARKRMSAAAALREGRHDVAAGLYGDLLDLDDGDPALRWAYGTALGAGVDPAAGKTQIQRALLMPLADPLVRRGVAEEIWLSGDREAALAQYAIAARWGVFSPETAVTGLDVLAGKLIEAEQPESAARVLAAALAMLLDEDAYAALDDRALYIAFYINSELYRARLLQAAANQDWDAAERDLTKSRAYLPQTEPAIDLIGRLDAAGEKARADRLFIEVYTPVATAVARFGQSSLLNNQAAWLAASCNRRLDSARRHAMAAVNADPTSPAALDTLAEVLLRLGETDRARELLDRILAAAEIRDMNVAAPLGELNHYIARRQQFLSRIEEQSIP